MEDTFKVFARVLAGFFAILFVLTTVLAVALYFIEQSAFDANLYKQALTEEKVYQRLPGLAAMDWPLQPKDPIAVCYRFSEIFQKKSGAPMCSSFCHQNS